MDPRPRRSLALAAAVTALLVGAGSAQAYVHAFFRPHFYGNMALATEGWYGGVGLTGIRILDQQGGPEQLASGLGVSLFGGFDVSERLSLELGWFESFHNPAAVHTAYGTDVDHLVLAGVTGDARIYLERQGGFAPYVTGGVGFYSLGSEVFGLDSVGEGFQLGGGFDIILNSVASLGLRARYLGIAMGPPRGGADDLFIHAASVEGTVSLRF